MNWHSGVRTIILHSIFTLLPSRIRNWSLRTVRKWRDQKELCSSCPFNLEHLLKLPGNPASKTRHDTWGCVSFILTKILVYSTIKGSEILALIYLFLLLFLLLVAVVMIFFKSHFVFKMLNRRHKINSLCYGSSYLNMI